MFEKLVERRKNAMTWPRQPWTCSHLIYTRTLTEIHQVVRYFLLAIFHASISIGILESDSLSLSTPSRTKWTLPINRIEASATLFIMSGKMWITFESSQYYWEVFKDFILYNTVVHFRMFVFSYIVWNIWRAQWYPIFQQSWKYSIFNA